MKDSIIFHVDVNSAFLSWVAVKRLQDGETVDLRTIPSAVGGDVMKRHGIITAKSIPAKAYGVTTGEPVVTALKKCPDLVLVQGDFRLYRKMSRAFMDICREFSPVIEPFSIDECFMDMTHAIPERDGKKAVETAERLKERIRNELSFTVNIGISENKLLAKMASDFTKPDRVHTLWTDEVPEKMWPLPVGDLLFVGKSSAEVLKKLGIRTIGELAKTPDSVLKAHLGEKAAASMKRSANGIGSKTVTDVQAEAKGYGNSTTLPFDITAPEEAYPVLLKLSESVAERMRKDSVKASVVTVHIRSNDFNNRSRQKKLDLHISSGELIYRGARSLFDSLWDKKTPLRLLGVSCGGLSDGKNEQMNLFGEEERSRQEKLDRMLDEIRRRHGKEAVVRGRFLEAEDRKGSLAHDFTDD